MTTKTIRCQHCRFFDKAEDFKDRGLCRVCPPAVGWQLFCGVGYQAEWPVVHVNDYCGEFMPKRKSK